jgi:hypothetical protein
VYKEAEATTLGRPGTSKTSGSKSCKHLLSAADGVDDVLRLLQLLFAISQDSSIASDQLLNVPLEEFFSKKVTNKVVQQIQVSNLLRP